MPHRYEYIISKLADLNVHVTNKTVVDCACGNGKGASYFKTMKATVLGIDIDPKCVKHAQRRGIDARLGDILDLDISENYCDIFICSETMEHLEREDCVQAVEHIKRIVKPDGVVCITVPFSKSVCFEKKGHKTWVNRTDLQRWFRGWECIEDSKFVKNPDRPKRSNLVYIIRKPIGEN